MTGRTNYTAYDNGLAPLGPDQMNGHASHFDALIGETAPNSSSLPTVDLFVGRTVTSLDTMTVYVCTSVSGSGTWRPIGSSHGEWTYAVAVPNASLTVMNAGSTAQGAQSSPNIASVVGTTASGFTANVAGVYIVTLYANLTAASSGRSFLSIVNNSTATEYRSSTTVEDLLTVTARIHMAAGSTASFQFFQTTGASRTVTGRFNISYLGPL